jgi:hypothetical protein
MHALLLWVPLHHGILSECTRQEVARDATASETTIDETTLE